MTDSNLIELVNKEQTEQIFGAAVNDSDLTDLNKCLRLFNITGKEDIRMFLAQCAHESGGLQFFSELATGDDYEWREDLGNTQEGDGRTYKGAGVIQLTGRANYQALADYLGDQEIMTGVDYVATKYPFTSAGYWWFSNGLSDYIAEGATIEQVSTRVNGGDPANGLDERIAYYEKAMQAI